MVPKSFILTIFLATSLLVPAQESSFIGMSKDEVSKALKVHHKDFGKDNTVVSTHFNYLKYINVDQTITWIIYFNDEDICRSTKMVCDYLEYDRMIKDLNEKYKSLGDMKWERRSEDSIIQLEVEELDWYFTIRERKINNRN